VTSPQDKLQKLYFRIGEVSSIVGVEPHVLRYWESEFRSVRPQKSARGQRIYSRRDVETLLKVKELLYSHRFTIAGAKLRLREGGPIEAPAPAAVAAPATEPAAASAATAAVAPSAPVTSAPSAAAAAPAGVDPAALERVRGSLVALRDRLRGLLAEVDGW
jgi:DNA-binding transcriptional MerR regulator